MIVNTLLTLLQASLIKPGLNNVTVIYFFLAKFLDINFYLYTLKLLEK